ILAHALCGAGLLAGTAPWAPDGRHPALAAAVLGEAGRALACPVRGHLAELRGRAARLRGGAAAGRGVAAAAGPPGPARAGRRGWLGGGAHRRWPWQPARRGVRGGGGGGRGRG
ncbi:unnamed protein product, partial [Prorocentrum cordatum]